ncbi:MAG: hypothetical protein AMJ90_04705 [candidate division Zixibacteria bacterium SM23_73_2]|nr:MAG: hypothetical protein AMJ90_04705 [candidate division Zixibacteria bacterium SM23_73_2]
MVEREVQIKNKLGLHARPAAMVVKSVSRFKSEIRFIKDDLVVNGKSILSVMGLAAEKGSIIKIRVEGEDEDQALEELVGLFESKFGEE